MLRINGLYGFIGLIIFIFFLNKTHDFVVYLSDFPTIHRLPM